MYLLRNRGVHRNASLPVVADGLKFYLEAMNPASAVATGNWRDLSGNGNHFSGNARLTTGAHPYYSSNAILYGPASNSLGITNSSGYTVQLFCNDLSDISSAAFKFYQNNASGSAGRGIFSHATWSNGHTYFDQGGCCGSSQRVYLSGPSNNVWTVLTFVRYPTQPRDIWFNTSRVARNTTSSAGIGLDGRSVTLLGDDQYGSAWNARVSTFACYNRPLSDSEIVDNVTAIRGLYGL